MAAERLQLLFKIIFVIFMTELSFSGVALGKESVSDFVESLLDPKVYNKKERPQLNEGKPVIVDIDVYVSSISGISEISMDYAINMFLRQRWTDSRLASTNHSIFNETITLNYAMVSKFWLPDLVITNEVTKGAFHDITVPNILLAVSPDGYILYSQRVSSVLACHMHLVNYPLDEQKCVMEFESYGHTTRDIIFRWRNMSDPVQKNDKMELPEFNFSNITLEGCTAQYTTGEFSCIRTIFKFERLFQYYVIQVYAPSCLIVVLSWVSFWIDINAVPARISVGLLTVLTITTQSSGISSKLPRVSYIKAIDVWMFISMFFVFGALMEYAVVNVLARSNKARLQKFEKERKERLQQETNQQMEMLDADSNKITLNIPNGNSTFNNDSPFPRKRSSVTGKDEVSIAPSCTSQNEKKMSFLQRIKVDRALMVDVISRFLFPLLYIVFNCFYWAYY